MPLPAFEGARELYFGYAARGWSVAFLCVFLLHVLRCIL